MIVTLIAPVCPVFNQLNRDRGYEQCPNCKKWLSPAEIQQGHNCYEETAESAQRFRVSRPD